MSHNGVIVDFDNKKNGGVRVCTAATKPFSATPADNSPFEGQVIYVTDNAVGLELEAYDGAAWQTSAGGLWESTGGYTQLKTTENIKIQNGNQVDFFDSSNVRVGIIRGSTALVLQTLGSIGVFITTPSGTIRSSVGGTDRLVVDSSGISVTGQIDVSLDVEFEETRGLIWETDLEVRGYPTSSNNLVLEAQSATGADIRLVPDDRVNFEGDLNVTGVLSKGSGSCLQTDIFYNSGTVAILRGMVCVSTGHTIGKRAFSKPITSVEPCYIENDKRVIGAKVFESISHSILNRKQLKEAASIVSDVRERPEKIDVMPNQSFYKNMVFDENNLEPECDNQEPELTSEEYEVVRQSSITYKDEKLHIGILGQYENVLVDADIEPIENGDMLTTSTTIGHGMKSVDRIPGTMFGNSLEDKPSGKGYVRTLLFNS